MAVFTEAPVLCGHRGSGRGVVAGHAENTLASALAAYEAGLRWVELDARLTADEVLVAAHDPVLGDGRFVADLTAEETGLARMDDLLAGLPEDLHVDLEVKSSLEDALRPRDRTTAARAAGLAASASGPRTVLLTSFDPAAVLIARDRAPQLPLGLLTWTRFPLRKAIPAAVHLGVEVLAAQFASFPLPDTPAAAAERDLQRTIAVAHEAGLELMAWCPPRAQREALAAAGVDCLVVDDAVAAPVAGLDSP